MSEERDVTSRTLFERVRDPSDAAAWERFYALYAPLLEGFARAQGLPPADAEELRDECLALVARKLPEFEYDPHKGAFKAWLHRIARGRLIDHLRRPRERAADTAVLAAVSDPAPTPDEAWERAWREEHLRFALREAAARVSERTFQAFALLLLDGVGVPEVCARMGDESEPGVQGQGARVGCGARGAGAARDGRAGALSGEESGLDRNRLPGGGVFPRGGWGLGMGAGPGCLREPTPPARAPPFPRFSRQETALDPE